MFALILLHPATFSWTDWTTYPSFMVGWLLLGGAYFLAAGPLRHHFPGSSPVPARKVALFVASQIVMLLSLQGPLHDLSDYFLFSAHMVQHLLLILIWAPLLLGSLTGWMVAPLFRIPGVLPVLRFLTRPLVAFGLTNAIFAFWHFPGPYDLMMQDHAVHITMHLMIMVMGVFMWWPVGSPTPAIPRISPPLQMVYLFVMGVPMMVVAAFIALSSTPLYQWYVEAPRITGLSPLEDQRLGGVIMWVPGALVIWLAITYVYFRWTQPEVEEDNQRLVTRRRSRAEPAPRISVPRYPGS